MNDPRPERPFGGCEVCKQHPAEYIERGKHICADCVVRPCPHVGAAAVMAYERAHAEHCPERRDP